MRLVELFCGAGGMSIGFKQAGFDIVHALDAWPTAVQIYRRNVCNQVSVADLSDISAVAPILFDLCPDVIAGGPPCQDTSPAGRRQEGDRAALTVAYAMIIAIVRPQWIVMENVPATLRSNAWKKAELILRRAGYGFTIEKLDAAFYGVGQRRERLVVVGRLGEEDGFLRSALLDAASKYPMTARQTLGEDIGDTIYVHPRHIYKRRIWSTCAPAPTVRKTYARRVPPEYAPIPIDAPTKSSPQALTRDQVAALQGFPSDFDWSSATLGDRDQMVANAVPIPLARAIATIILCRHSGETQPTLEKEFTSWLQKRGHAGSTIDDIRTKVNRARRLLDGRVVATTALEIAMLEEVAEFKQLPSKTQSALRVALRLHSEFRVEKHPLPLDKKKVSNARKKRQVIQKLSGRPRQITKDSG